MKKYCFLSCYLFTTLSIADGQVQMNGTIDVYRNHYTDINSKFYTFNTDEGFPHTAFKGAFFFFGNDNLYKNTQATDYKWKSNQSWVKVNEFGKITFIESPTNKSNTAIITATPNSKIKKTPLTYSIRISKWFYVDPNVKTMNWNDANNYCANKGLKLPTLFDLINATTEEKSNRKSMPSLWPEWGNVGSFFYESKGSIAYWTSTPGVDKHKFDGRSHHYYVGMHTNPIIQTTTDSESLLHVTCVDYINSEDLSNKSK